MRLCFRLLTSFPRPCEMAVLAVILLFHTRDGGQCADDEIWDERAFGELWKDDSWRLAFRASNRTSQDALGVVAFQGTVVGALETLGGYFDAYAGHVAGSEPKSAKLQVVVDFSRDAVLVQAMSEWFGIRAPIKHGD